MGSGIAVDSSGNAYVTGVHLFHQFPHSECFPGNGRRLGCVRDEAQCGGLGAGILHLPRRQRAVDVGYGIAVDSSGNAYVTGLTTSSDFPTANPLQYTLKGYENVFVTKLNATGAALVYSTFLGGSGRFGYAIALDPFGNAYVTGATFSTISPLTLSRQCMPIPFAALGRKCVRDEI